jgi:hypothetical protein
MARAIPPVRTIRNGSEIIHFSSPTVITNGSLNHSVIVIAPPRSFNMFGAIDPLVSILFARPSPSNLFVWVQTATKNHHTHLILVLREEKVRKQAFLLGIYLGLVQIVPHRNKNPQNVR